MMVKIVKAKMKLSGLIVTLIGISILCGFSGIQHATEVWKLSSLEAIGGYKLLVLGAPKVVKKRGVKSIAFDGVDDGILIAANPIAGADAFSVEVVFKPYAAYPDNLEQRFLHIQDPDNPNRRILIELRLNDKQQWYADFFMRSDVASLTLIDSSKTHPVKEWATITMVYKDGALKGLVNGVEEVSGKIKYLPISPTAKTSIGTRMDRRSWFKGEIRSVIFSKLVQ